MDKYLLNILVWLFFLGGLFGVVMAFVQFFNGGMFLGGGGWFVLGDRDLHPAAHGRELGPLLTSALQWAGAPGSIVGWLAGAVAARRAGRMTGD